MLRRVAAAALSLALISGTLAAEEAEPAEPPPADATAPAAPAEEDTGAAADAGAPVAPEPAAAEPSGAEPGPGVEEGGPRPEGGEAPDTPKDDEVRPKVYEYIEDLTISGPGAKVHVRSSVLVVVTTEGRRIRVEVRPKPMRERTKTEDPAPGKVALITEAGGNTSWDIKPQSAVFDFTPGPRGVVSIEGPAREAVNEAITVLSQGPGESTPKEKSVTAYGIRVRSNKRPIELGGEQRTKKLWVDWNLSGTGSGAFEVGVRAWEMDMDFVLPEGPVDVKKGKARLGAKADIRYSSVRPGPEAETTLVTTLTLTHKKDKYTYVRKSWLRPGYVLDETLEDKEKRKKKPSGPATKKALAGRASAWARTATLATLGVQRLAGVRETGLAMWLAQASIDSAAGRVLPRAAAKPQRRTLKTVAKLSPLLEPPEGLLRDDLFSENWLVRFETGQSLIDMRSSIAGGKQGGRNAIVVPNISLSVRRKIKKRWRLGGGLEGMLVRVDTGDPRVSWSCLNLSGRAEYLAETWNLGLSFGASFLQYNMDSSSRAASGDLQTVVYGLDAEKLLRKRWGLGLHFRFAGDPYGFRMIFAQPAARWYFTRNAALQLHMAITMVNDPEAIGGEIVSWGTGGGVGVTMRW